MFEILQRFFINAKAIRVSEQYAMRLAKKEYLTGHGECAVCGNRKYLEVHHVKPVHIYPELSCSLENFIVLCDAKNNSCHRWIGHFGNYSSKWNDKIREYSFLCRLFLEKQCKDREFILSSADMANDFSKALGIS
jgi:5-methylcytosine-specific restriction endonuclease McrA